MAYANVQNSGKLSTTSSATLSWTPSAPTVNNLMTGRFWSFNSAPASANCHDSTGTPVNFTLDVSKNDGGGEWTGIWSLLVPGGGLTTPILNANGSQFKFGMFDEWSGNATTSILDTSTSNTANSTTADTGTITTGANAGLVLACLNDDENNSNDTIASTGTSFADDDTFPQNTSFPGSASSRTATVASQVGLHQTWTKNGGTYSACIASYNASGAAPPVVAPPPTRTLTGAGI